MCCLFWLEKRNEKIQSLPYLKLIKRRTHTKSQRRRAAAPLNHEHTHHTHKNKRDRERWNSILTASAILLCFLYVLIVLRWVKWQIHLSWANPSPVTTLLAHFSLSRSLSLCTMYYATSSMRKKLNRKNVVIHCIRYACTV